MPWGREKLAQDLRQNCSAYSLADHIRFFTAEFVDLAHMGSPSRESQPESAFVSSPSQASFGVWVSSGLDGQGVSPGVHSRETRPAGSGTELAQRLRSLGEEVAWLVELGASGC